MQSARDITTYRKFWAARFGTAPFLPISRAEMDELQWDSCDIILVTGDAYVDHPSFGMGVIGRALEALQCVAAVAVRLDEILLQDDRALVKGESLFELSLFE